VLGDCLSPGFLDAVLDDQAMNFSHAFADDRYWRLMQCGVWSRKLFEDY
jgi:hypothetical protein